MRRGLIPFSVMLSLFNIFYNVLPDWRLLQQYWTGILFCEVLFLLEKVETKHKTLEVGIYVENARCQIV